MARKLPEALKAHQFKKGGNKASVVVAKKKVRKGDTKLIARRKKGAPVTPDLRAR